MSQHYAHVIVASSDGSLSQAACGCGWQNDDGPVNEDLAYIRAAEHQMTTYDGVIDEPFVNTIEFVDSNTGIVAAILKSDDGYVYQEDAVNEDGDATGEEIRRSFYSQLLPFWLMVHWPTAQFTAVKVDVPNQTVALAVMEPAAVRFVEDRFFINDAAYVVQAGKLVESNS